MKAEEKIREGAKPFLQEGEEILAGFAAWLAPSPRTPACCCV